MNRRNTLECIQDCEEMYGALVTNRTCSRRDVMRCVRAGLAKSVGPRQLMDGDNCAVEPEQYREGFQLTAAGRKWLVDDYAARIR